MAHADHRFVLHVGYPKTATTTFQQHVFPNHPGITYLGKNIPSFRYGEPGLYELVEDLVQKSTFEWEGPETLRAMLARLRAASDRRCVLLSSESFIHPNAIDVGLVAERLAAAAGPCKILITIREQISSLLSWYWMHGRFAQYFAIGGKETATPLDYPFSFHDWVTWERTAPYKSYASTLHYDKVVAYYQRVFGADNVRVLLFEQFTSDAAAYTAALSDWLGVDAEPMTRLAASRHENRSDKRTAPWIGQDAAQLGTSGTSKGLLARLLERRTASPPPPAIETTLASLRETFAPGNARLAARLGLPLDAHGYAVAKP